jgi:hypothetical protein
MMRKLRKHEADGVLVHKIDRGARNLRDWADVGDLIHAAFEVYFVTLLSIYEVVGHVKRKIRHTSPFGLGGLSRAPVFWAFISTLDSPPNPHNGARNEAKRSSVEPSFHG